MKENIDAKVFPVFALAQTVLILTPNEYKPVSFSPDTDNQK
jgi:hypothetical protein